MDHEDDAMSLPNRLLLIVTATLVVVFVLLGLALVFNNFVVNLLWFKSLGYEPYFWYRLLYRYVLFTAATLFFFLIFFLNFWIGAKHLGVKAPSRAIVGSGARGRWRERLQRFQGRSLVLYLPLSLALAAIVALPLYLHWERALLYFASQSAGMDDPVYGQDITWYLFSLPIYSLVLREVLIAFAVALLGLMLMYRIENQVVPADPRPLPRSAKVHLSVMTGLTFVIGAGWFVLQRYQLLYSDRHMPLFYGPGYVEMHVTLPLIWLCMFLVLVLGLLSVRFLTRSKGLVGVVATGVLLLVAIGARHSSMISRELQKYLVEPNELSLEAPYIKNNIRATLAAYHLDDVETREYATKGLPWHVSTSELKSSLQNIPIWDKDDLFKVFNELQAIRTYYDFNSISAGRYTIQDFYRQVFLSAREIDLKALPEDAKNWVNAWMRYTHGYGAVMTPSAQMNAGPMTWLLQSIPPHSDYGIDIKQPGIYYGLGDLRPAIAPNDAHEVDYATDNSVATVDYQGSGGVSVSGAFRKLLFALYFGEKNIFFTTQTNAKSRMLFRRNIVHRIETLTPFLSLDPDPYLVITPDRLYWIQDAYTSSSWYPNSRPYDGRFFRSGVPFNYIRNSVKIVVDAYDGSIDYYIVDPSDPIVQAYARIYPGLFKNFADMPKELKFHIRYPKTLFDMQMEIYARYHQQDPRIYFDQEDMWVFPELLWQKNVTTMTSYYLTLNLLDPDRYEFSLLLPMDSKGRRNMRALVLVGCDGDNYGRIVVYSFSKGTLVYGPPQVESVIEQDPKISRQLTLWNQQGSSATRGRMVILPIDGVVTYLQGVFLESATAAKIPELVRFIVSEGEFAAMEPSLPEAFAALNKEIGARASTKQSVRGQPIVPPKQAPSAGVTPGAN